MVAIHNQMEVAFGGLAQSFSMIHMFHIYLYMTTKKNKKSL